MSRVSSYAHCCTRPCRHIKHRVPRARRRHSPCSSVGPRGKLTTGPPEACEPEDCATDKSRGRTLEAPISFCAACGADGIDVTGRAGDATWVRVAKDVPTSTRDAELLEPRSRSRGITLDHPSKLSTDRDVAIETKDDAVGGESEALHSPDRAHLACEGTEDTVVEGESPFLECLSLSRTRRKGRRLSALLSLSPLLQIFPPFMRNTLGLSRSRNPWSPTDPSR
ncbi:hypothetical protein AMTR_s00035p00171730 [Amborella trichopoda]|uniref:Uncharacterized protein n=1 Tax=Amborella trichopoda TaxID=13333 RepID=W1PWC8_AMBTC|nr:hypothetical protein AMTR_s00035p00171730 [Amborella trichopoda]